MYLSLFYISVFMSFFVIIIFLFLGAKIRRKTDSTKKSFRKGNWE